MVTPHPSVPCSPKPSYTLRYMSTLSTALLLLALKECVRIRPYPAAPRNLPVPPTTGSSLTSSRMASLPITATELRLCLPAVNTTLAENSSWSGRPGRHEVEPLRAPDGAGRRVGPLRQHVVDHIHVAEPVDGVARCRRRSPHRAHRRRRAPRRYGVTVSCM